MQAKKQEVQFLRRALLVYFEQVVVDNEVVGSQLLKNGKLRKRVTIIPLNKIQAFRAHAQVYFLLFLRGGGAFCPVNYNPGLTASLRSFHAAFDDRKLRLLNDSPRVKSSWP